jgi:hypothetical protein
MPLPVQPGASQKSLDYLKIESVLDKVHTSFVNGGK